jgi:sugar O-acyltransferase (sialic acid O-acetyltransferase NeuD family)
MVDLYIIGAGSVGGYIASNFQSFGSSFQLKGFLDDNPGKQGKEFCGLPVVGGVDMLKELPDVAIVVGIAFPKIKIEIIKRLEGLGHFCFPTLISPNSWVSDGVRLGLGNIIYPGVSINYGTLIGDFVVINMNCAIGHDVSIGNYVSIAPGVNLGGSTIIGNGVELGIGSATKQSIKIHDNSIVGGQSMVIVDVPENSIVAGIPAKKIKGLISFYS